jgi:NCS1 family nucleobase:cation symporter-1
MLRHGLNWRAFLAYTLGMFPALPGFIHEVQPSIHVNDTWRRFFQISFFFGYIVSGSLHYLLNKYFPPPGLGHQVDFVLDDSGVVEVVDAGSEDGHIYSKAAEATEVKV